MQNSKCTNFVRHLIVASPGYVFHALVDEDWRDVVLLLEDFGCLGGEGCGGVGAGDGDNGCWGVNEKSLISCFFRAKI